ncbi:MAG: N-acetylmuramoyl-L-alanine amidase [Selenomonadaceae bacterium]|nr:N-acetylmuramoyl-L-alanine amidase [Selenomonadaceae bacterium]
MGKVFFHCALIFCAAIIFMSSPAQAEDVPFTDKFILWTEHRDELIDEYTLKHYGMICREIIPQAVVVHWTAFGTLESNWKFFYAEEMPDDEGRLNVASQFIVDRDGTILRLMPETKFARHIIGYNHCAIGIENVGGYNGREDLTEAQLAANVRLIKWLHEKYPTIKYVFGHYQQGKARASGLFIENVPGYYAIKTDPGPKFMRGLREELEGDGLIFYDE